MYTDRFYRDWVESDLTAFEVKVEETDIFVLADTNLENEAKESVMRYRNDIKNYIESNPEFGKSLKPIAFDKSASPIVKEMLSASEKAGVGPMAAVAGAIAEFVGKDLLKFSEEVIVENGGDIFIKSSKDRKFAIFAGNSPLSGKISINIKTKDMPLGVCTSSGTVSHSLSFGKADAVCVVAKNTALADAAATAICNSVKTKDDIKKSLNFSKTIDDVMGCVIIFGDRVGSIGKIELV